MGWRVGIDTGGTFTDLVAVRQETGEIYTAKVPSNPENPAKAIINALQQLSGEKSVDLNQIGFFAHGTTVATNAVIESKGVKAGLLITRGMRAIYDMRGGTRPRGSDLIDPFYRKPPSLIPQSLTREIHERLAFDGEVVEELDEDSVRLAVLDLKEKGVQSIAVCCLFSFINPDHELRTAQIIGQYYPECRVSLSHQVLPVIREYPRLSTTALDAYVGPVVQRYFNYLQHELNSQGLATNQFYIMQSNGGLMRINIAVRYPNETLLSGPAAGVVFATYLGRTTGIANLVTFDMGGTSTDISVIYQNEYSETREGKIAGQEVGTPMIQIRALGAGGGTIAFIGKDGLLKVGPESAGAFPGPACYCRGGTEPTVTDANMTLGYLSETNFVGGRMKADKALAEQALGRVGQALNLNAVETAVGILKIANAHMSVGVRATLIERGVDPRSFTLAAFGGSGPLHAAAVAKEVGIPRVVVPRFPGVTCAMGLLDSDAKHIYMQSCLQSLDRLNIGQLGDYFRSLEKQAMADAEFEGLTTERTFIYRQVDLRYPYQGYELTIECPDVLNEDTAQLLRTRFHEEHQRVYGTSAVNETPEIVNARVLLIGKTSKLETMPLSVKGIQKEALKGSRPAYFDSVKKFVETPIYDRNFLGAGSVLEGPAIIEQADSTVVVEPGMLAEMDGYGNLLIHIESPQKASVLSHSSGRVDHD